MQQRSASAVTVAALTADRCCEQGAGMSCKLLHNATVFASDMVLAEAMTTAAASGIDTDAFHSVLCNAALGKAFQLHVRLRETWLAGEFEPARFQLKTAFKDVSLAVITNAFAFRPIRIVWKWSKAECLLGVAGGACRGGGRADGDAAALPLGDVGGAGAAGLGGARHELHAQAPGGASWRGGPLAPLTRGLARRTLLCASKVVSSQ